jgi:hypothetical protein
MAIVILGTTEDEHAAHVAQFLSAIGRRVVVLDSRLFPGELQITYGPSSDSGSIRFGSGEMLRFGEIRSIYWRNYFGPVGPELPNAEQAFVAANDSRGLLESVLIRLPVKWVNGWLAYQSHQTKPAQLAALAARGIPVPDTIVTNDPEQVRQFAESHRHVVYKPVQGGAHARRLEKRHLSREHLDNLRFAPLTLQEEIPGVSVRVFIAGDQLFACEFETAALDYRDDPDAKLHAVEIPDDVAGFCRVAAETLDLVWTGIDLRRTPEGRYVLLEANPSPMFLGFEERTGQPLTAALVKLLMN